MLGHDGPGTGTDTGSDDEEQDKSADDPDRVAATGPEVTGSTGEDS